MTSLGRVGIYSGELRFLRDRAQAEEAAAEVEQLGFGALWVPGGAGTGLPLFDVLEGILAATERIPVVSAILSIWVEDAQAAAAGQLRLRTRFPGRFVLGLGTSHAPLVDESVRERLAKPRTAMAEYLDELDAAVPEEARRERLLGALGPRMLELAGARTLGTHPYLVTPEHTRAAREILGDGPLIAPEQAVILEEDPAVAREIARRHLAVYLGLPNYTSNWLRHGLTEADLRDGGSDRLVDELVAWGDEQRIAERIAGHHDAGADHVALMVLRGEKGLPTDVWRRLAPLAG
jgi:probable F420-dependent oxidoreductase